MCLLYVFRESLIGIAVLFRFCCFYCSIYRTISKSYLSIGGQSNTDGKGIIANTKNSAP